MEHVDISNEQSIAITTLYRIYTACRERNSIHRVLQTVRDWDVLTIAYIGDNVADGHILGSAVCRRGLGTMRANLQCAAHTPYVFKFTLDAVESYARTQFACDQCTDHSCVFCKHIMLEVGSANADMVRLYGMHGYELSTNPANTGVTMRQNDGVILTTKILFAPHREDRLVNMPHDRDPQGQNMKNFGQAMYDSVEDSAVLATAIDHLHRKFMAGYVTRLIIITILTPEAGIAKKRKM